MKSCTATAQKHSSKALILIQEKGMPFTTRVIFKHYFKRYPGISHKGELKRDPSTP